MALASQYRETLLLVFFRLEGMLTVAPVVGHRSIPIPHRAGLALLVALLLTPIVGPAPRASADGALALTLAVAGELFVGLVIGFVAALVVAAVQGAAELIAFQMGLGIAAAYDPAMGQQASVLTRFHEVVALLLFLTLNGHHVLLRAVSVSFERIQPGAALAHAQVAAGVVALGGKLLRSGLELAAPVVGVLFVVNVAMALLARVAPQMNVFAVGAPVTIAIGLFGLVESFPQFLGVVTRLTGDINGDLGAILLRAAHGIR